MSPSAGPARTTEDLKADYERIYATTGIVDAPAFYRWIATLLRPAPGARVLDVACGEGWVIAEARRLGARAVGVDIAHAAAKKAAAAVGPAFIVGDGERLPFPDGAFDGATCLGSVENMADPWRAVAEIARVTRPEGRIVLMMPNAFWLGDVFQVLWKGVDDTPFQEIERRATPAGWRHFLEAQGLAVERMLGYNKPTVLFRHGKLKSVRKFIVRSLLNAVTPANLSWSLVFICRKAPPRAPAAPYWIWEALQSRHRA